MVTKVDKGPSPRERLLAAADELFYDEGVHTVGIDRIIERAGVAKGSLYYNFGGKDDLIRAYLLGRHTRWAALVDEGIARETDPAEKILSVFDTLGVLFAKPDYRGCAFANAMAESLPASAERIAGKNFRAWVHETFSTLVAELGVEDKKALTDRLVVLYDGANATSQQDETAEPARIARDMAELFVSRALEVRSSAA
ncbi:TetR/AcrR family transcriptional regulator [soil metagenome]